MTTIRKLYSKKKILLWKIAILNKKHGVKKQTAVNKNVNTEHERQKEGNKQVSLNSYANREVKQNKILKVIKHVSLSIESSKEQ